MCTSILKHIYIKILLEVYTLKVVHKISKKINKNSPKLKDTNKKKKTRDCKKK